MKAIVWLLPLLFILHDMEEIILAIPWKNSEAPKKRFIRVRFVPFGTFFNTESFSIAGLLERERRGFSAPNRLYVKVPPVPVVRFSDQLMAGKATLIQSEKRPYDGRKTDPMMVGKPTPNKTNINNLIENQTMRASGEPPTAYGRYENIFLSKDEYDELQAEYPDRLERLIEEMSHYLAASGKAYQNYAAALHRWAANDKKGAVKQGIPDYTCMEGESL